MCGSEIIKRVSPAHQEMTSDMCQDHSIDANTRSLRSSDMMNLEVKEYVRRGNWGRRCDQCSSCLRHMPMVRITFLRDSDDIGAQ